VKNYLPHKQTNKLIVSALSEGKPVGFFFFDDLLKRKLVLFRVKLDIPGDDREAFPQPPLHAKERKKQNFRK